MVFGVVVVLGGVLIVGEVAGGGHGVVVEALVPVVPIVVEPVVLAPVLPIVLVPVLPALVVPDEVEAPA